jgi:DNA-binding transcriptional ArsR family regulator
MSNVRAKKTSATGGAPSLTSAELLLHPVRLRVVQALLGDRELTTAQLAAEIDDVPPATLYRHVAKLAEAGVLEVVAERRTRGSVERTYRLVPGAGSVTEADLAAMSTDEHRQAFLVFMASVIKDFDRYLTAGRPDLVRDLVGYRQAALHLTDAELREMVADIAAVVEARRGLPPRPGTRRRALSTILIPTDETTAATPTP